MKSLAPRNFVTQDIIETLFTEKQLVLDFSEILSDELEPYPNSYHVLVGMNNSSAIVRYCGEDLFKLVDSNLKIDKIRPKDLEQTCLADALMDPHIKIIACTGPAGGGKTFLSLAWALTELVKDKKSTRKLVLTKPTLTVGASKFFGAVPGSTAEKFEPFLDSYEMAMNKILDKTYVELLKTKEQILYKPIEFCRGTSYEDTVLIVDESQGITWHQLKTVLTRLGASCKAIVLGDISQKDGPKDDKSGLEMLISSVEFNSSDITSTIRLVNDYRGEISKLISAVADEVED